LLQTDITEIPPVLPILSCPVATSEVDVLPAWKDGDLRQLSQWHIKLREAVTV